MELETGGRERRAHRRRRREREREKRESYFADPRVQLELRGGGPGESDYL
jgi:hypothetical protein